MDNGCFSESSVGECGRIMNSKRRALQASFGNGTGSPFVADPTDVGGGDDVESLKVPLHAPCETGLLLTRQTCAGSGDAFGVALFGCLGNQLLRIGHCQFGRSVLGPSVHIQYRKVQRENGLSQNTGGTSGILARQIGGEGEKTYTCCLMASLRSAELPAPAAGEDLPVSELRSILTMLPQGRGMGVGGEMGNDGASEPRPQWSDEQDLL
jgi:hypothetical protein